MKTLRDYQQRGVDLTYDWWSKNPDLKNLMLVYPTGAGKTLIKAEFAKHQKNKEHITLLFAHKDTLLSQISESLCDMNVNHSFIAVNRTIKEITDEHLTLFNKSFYDPTSNVIVVSVDTYIRRLEKGVLDEIIPDVKLWLLDEAHHCLKDNKWGRCVKPLINAKGIGVTATPIRGDKKGLGSDFDGVFDDMIVGSTNAELLNLGWLSPYKVFVPPQLLNVDDLKATPSGDYNNKKLAERTDTIAITGDAVKQYLKLANGKQAITFTVNIAHAEHVAKEFNRHGVCSVALSSKTPLKERNKAFREFKKGLIKNLVNCDLFGEGVDVPAVSCVIMLRKTLSYSLFKQQFGRMLRVIEGKDFGILIDHVGNVKYHCVYGDPHDDPEWTLERLKRTRGDNQEKRGRTCPECHFYYIPKTGNNYLCPDCYHEETEQEINQQEQKYINDNTQLIEMNVNFVKDLLHERNNKVYLDAEDIKQRLTHSGQHSKIINGAVNQHRRRQYAQNRLRQGIQHWCYKKAKENDWQPKTVQMYFEKVFKINILKAQVLGERPALDLLEKINNE